MFYDAMEEALKYIALNKEGWERRFYAVATAIEVNPRLTNGRLRVLIDLGDRLKQQNADHASRINTILTMAVRNGATDDYQKNCTQLDINRQNFHVLMVLQIVTLISLTYDLIKSSM